MFKELYAIDVRKKIKRKKDLNYLPWASAWAEIMKIDDNATYDYLCQELKFGTGDNLVTVNRPWFDDGRTGWVETIVTINGKTKKQMLPIMDYKNAAVPADKISSTDANKAIMRCLVKCIAQFGLGLYLYEGDDLPESSKEIIELREKVKDLAKKKNKSEALKEKVLTILKEAQARAYPELNEDELNGNIAEIEDEEILKDTQEKLLALRIVPKK